MDNSVRRLEVPYPIRSLAWAGDALIDWVGGGSLLHLDGTVQHATVRYSYRFDAVAVSPCGDFVVIYEKLGTTGLVLAQGKVLRQINRSFYHADDYEFPVAIFRARSGRVLMAHCPEDYNRLEIDDVQTGERLTASDKREPSDFFHSQLRVSADGRWLLSAGWIWHPWSTVKVFDIEAALKDPNALDRALTIPPAETELVAAEFMRDNRIVAASSDETMLDEGETVPAGTIGVNSLAVFRAGSAELLSCAAVKEPVGSLMPVDDDTAVGFYGHPTLFSLKTGEVLKRWQDIDTGRQLCCILRSGVPIPPIACDTANRRFAVAAEGAVSVVDIP